MAIDTPPARCDLIVRGAAVYDGTGAPPVAGDVAVSGERIVAVGDLAATAADFEIDGAGRALAPGFIDVHTHDDRHLIFDPSVAAKASQGVTTVVVGNCGISLAPMTRPEIPPPPFELVADRPELCFASMGDYLDALDRTPAALNSAALVGHTVLRHDCLDDLERSATDAEIAAMEGLLAESLAAGAFGLSSGLYYPPARAASTDEVAGVAAALAPVDGIYTAHIRDEADEIAPAIEEAAEIGRRAGVQTIISHHKCAGRPNYGRSAETLAMIERLRGEQRLGLDQYPYTAGSTSLLPEMIGLAERVMVTWSKARPEFAGRDLDDIAAAMGLSVEAAIAELQPAGAVYFMMDEADVERIMAFPATMIGSDGLPSDSHPHPRLWGTFARVLGHYVRERGVLSLAEAVHRMTGLPAAEFGLRDRGAIRAGAFADLVLFDPAVVADSATFDEPRQPAAGIELVVVNGVPIWRDGAATGERPGRALRRQDSLRGTADAAP